MAKEVLRLELINVQLLVLCYDYIVRDGKVYVHLSNQVGLIKKMYQRAFDNFTSRVAIRKLQKIADSAMHGVRSVLLEASLHKFR